MADRSRSWIQEAEMSFLHRVTSLSLLFSHPEGARSRALLLHIQGSQLRWFRYLIRMDPGRGSLGMSHCEEVPGKTQNLLAGMWIFSELWDPPGGGWSCWGERSLDFPPGLVACPTDYTQYRMETVLGVRKYCTVYYLVNSGWVNSTSVVEAGHPINVSSYWVYINNDWKYFIL